jgi:hypothetical protein
MSLMNTFDRAAFRAAVAVAAELRLVGVDMPGIGHCWVRRLTMGDWVTASAAVAKLQAQGVEVTPALRAAIGLAQNLCGPDGESLFEVDSLSDLKMLAALPSEQVAAALVKAGEVNAMPGESPGDHPNA